MHSKNANYTFDAESSKQSSSSPSSNISVIAAEDKNCTHADRSNRFGVPLDLPSLLFLFFCSSHHARTDT